MKKQRVPDFSLERAAFFLFVQNAEDLFILRGTILCPFAMSFLIAKGYKTPANGARKVRLQFVADRSVKIE